MRVRGFIILASLLMTIGDAYAQVQPHDTIPAFLADSINAVYIYADTGTALNRIDKEGRKQGLWEKRYSDGNLRYRGHFIDDRPYGVFKNYYDETDSLQAIRAFYDSGLVAYVHMFYITGALEAEGKYVNEKKDSIWKFYSAVQRLILKSQYANNKREGKSVSFYPDGNTLEVKTWQNDSENGPFQQYYDEGLLREEGNYAHGWMEDTLYIYDLDGNMAIKGKYLHDMKEGSWIYYKDGTPKDTLIYHRGRCVNCDKYMPTKRQEDSLKIHYQKLQEQLDHPSDDLENGYGMPSGE